MAKTTTTTTTTTKSNTNNSNNNNIPKLCQFWLFIECNLPKIKLFGLDVSLTIVSTLFLMLVRYLAEFIMVLVFNWPSNSLDTKKAACSVTSIVHSINLVPVLYILLLQTVSPKYNPSSSMTSETAGIWWNTTVNCMLQFCTGYMLYDTILNVFWLNLNMNEQGIITEDLLLLGHHIATILYMSSTRLVQAGHQSAMMCMLIGEITNPIHNSYYIGVIAQKLSCCNGPTSQLLFYYIRFIFGCLYVLFRSIIGPILILHASYNLIVTSMFDAKQKLSSHKPLVLFWIFLMWAVLIGSIPWVTECWGFVLLPLPSSVSSTLISIFGGKIIPIISTHDEL